MDSKLDEKQLASISAIIEQKIRQKEEVEDKSEEKRNLLLTKEQLKNRLNVYKNVLSSQMREYLLSLIELEFSVLRPYISDVDRKVLTELEVYRQIAIYNIYNRAKLLLKSSKEELNINIPNDEPTLDDAHLYANQMIGNTNVRLFEFHYEDYRPSYLEIPEEFKNLSIGYIRLFLTQDRPDLRRIELIKAKKDYAFENELKNPYTSLTREYVDVPSKFWYREHERRLAELNHKISILEERKELTEEQKRVIQVQQKCYELFLKDYGLSEEQFKEASDYEYIFNHDSMKKTLKKKYPGITIQTNIEYL